jgi:hypothetical protein
VSSLLGVLHAVSAYSYDIRTIYAYRLFSHARVQTLFTSSCACAGEERVKVCPGSRLPRLEHAARRESPWLDRLENFTSSKLV